MQTLHKNRGLESSPIYIRAIFMPKNCVSIAFNKRKSGLSIPRGSPSFIYSLWVYVVFAAELGKPFFYFLPYSSLIASTMESTQTTATATELTAETKRENLSFVHDYTGVKCEIDKQKLEAIFSDLATYGNYENPFLEMYLSLQTLVNDAIWCGISDSTSETLRDNAAGCIDHLKSLLTISTLVKTSK